MYASPFNPLSGTGKTGTCLKLKKMTEIETLKKKLARIEAELDKCRTSVLQDGWQTQRFAKKSRKWDYFAQEKMKIIGRIDEIESKEVYEGSGDLTPEEFEDRYCDCNGVVFTDADPGL